MPRLNQLLAGEKAAKNHANDAITAAYHLIQKTTPLSGIERSYQPLNDEDPEVLPPESTRVQVKADEVIDRVRKVMADMWNVTAAREWANTAAVADIVVDGTTLAEKVPVGALLFLERQLVDLYTFVSKLPLLDPAQTWTKDPTSGVYRSDPIKTNRSKKLPKVLSLAPATDKHAAQVQLIQEDVITGTWTTVHFSGALPADRVNELVDRVEKLQRAVKFAREEANSTKVDDKTLGNELLGWVFA